VTPDGVNPSTTTLTVKTGGALLSHAGNSAIWPVSATVLLGGVLLLPFGRRRRIHATLTVLGLLILLFGVGCGGGSMQRNTTPQTFTLNVMSSGPAGSKTVPLVVNITQ
jgi:hypothetical protein